MQSRTPGRPAATVRKPRIRALLAGALGGLAGFLIAEPLNAGDPGTQGQLLLRVGLWAGLVGLALGSVLLVNDNLGSLRGRWSRNLLAGAPLFGGLALSAGVIAQLYYASAPATDLTRAVGWAIFGALIGSSIGLLRRELPRVLRGTLGGLAGGFIGGLVFNTVFRLAPGGTGQLSRAIGVTILGAAIATAIQAVELALRRAWLFGLTTGPYEGKEYTLSKARVTIGRSDANDISLYRDATVPLNAGALSFERGAWRWRGQAVSVNGAPTGDRIFTPGDTIRLGRTEFRFETRADHEHPPAEPPPAPPEPSGAPGTWSLDGPTGSRLLPEGPVSVGRAPENTIVILDATVSSRHASLEAGLRGLVVRDAGSTNGTFLNGVLQPAGSLALARPGDRLRFGSVEYTVGRFEGADAPNGVTGRAVR